MRNKQKDLTSQRLFSKYIKRATSQRAGIRGSHPGAPGSNPNTDEIFSFITG